MKKDKILIADDDEIIMTLHGRILKNDFPDYELEKFKDGTSFERRLFQDTGGVALAIVDNQMPGIEGNEIIRKYAGKFPFPFVLVYGGDNEIGEQALRDGAAGYLRKPFNPRQYVGLVNLALSKSRVI